jgi:NAD(P)-dependent dehydrogenase (short-subunit alcohol dehydrogenase family)
VTITLITGGNKSLGREAARRLIELGWPPPGSVT